MENTSPLRHSASLRGWEMRLFEPYCNLDKVLKGTENVRSVLFIGGTGTYKTLHLIAAMLSALMSDAKAIFITYTHHYTYITNVMNGLGWGEPRGVRVVPFRGRERKSTWCDAVIFDRYSLFLLSREAVGKAESGVGSVEKPPSIYSRDVLMYAVLTGLRLLGVIRSKVSFYSIRTCNLNSREWINRLRLNPTDVRIIIDDLPYTMRLAPFIEFRDAVLRPEFKLIVVGSSGLAKAFDTVVRLEKVLAKTVETWGYILKAPAWYDNAVYRVKLVREEKAQVGRLIWEKVDSSQ